MMVTKIKALVRGALMDIAQFAGAEEQACQVSGRGDLLIAQALPPYAELVRMGGSWEAMSVLQTPVQAVPTTTAGLSLFNGEKANGRSYVIDSLFVFNGVTQALATNLSIMKMLNKGIVAAPSGGTLITPSSLSGKDAYGAAAKVKSGSTVVNDVWTPWGDSAQDPTTADFGFTVDKMADGRLIVPPGGCLSIAAIVATAPVATSVQIGVRWHEVALALG